MTNANFEGVDFRDARLADANLQNINLYQAKLNRSDLQRANLTGARLVQAQLVDANLTAATLTGACIEDWNISTHTILANVSCQFVFMRDMQVGSQNYSHRRPHNKDHKFEDGDFADFIRPLTDTLDLYHNRDVDPRAVAIAFQTLAAENPEANLLIVAMESRRQGKFLLRAKADPRTDTSDLSFRYYQICDAVKQLSASEQQQLYLEMQKTAQNRDNVINPSVSQTTIYIAQFDGVLMSGEGNINIGRDMVGNVIGDENTVDIDIQHLDLPKPQTVNIHQELDALKQILIQLQSEDRRKISNAFLDAEDELKKNSPNRDEVGKAVKRVLDYAQKTDGFIETVKKIQPHVVSIVSWLGKNWHKLLSIVGLAA